jgi:hypothetical protein
MYHPRFTLLFLACLASPFVAQAQTHCTKKEVEYFSCKIRGSEKVVSVCGSVFRDRADATASIVDEAWIQYRFGKPGHVELTHPEKHQPLLGRFFAEFIVANDSRLYALGFKRGGYRYEILDSPGLRGVTVEGQGSKAQLPCDGEPRTPRREDLNDFHELVMMLNRQG